jgi:hypothetical protein
MVIQIGRGSATNGELSCDNTVHAVIISGANAKKQHCLMHLM